MLPHRFPWPTSSAVIPTSRIVSLLRHTPNPQQAIGSPPRGENLPLGIRSPHESPHLTAAPLYSPPSSRLKGMQSVVRVRAGVLRCGGLSVCPVQKPRQTRCCFSVGSAHC